MSTAQQSSAANVALLVLTGAIVAGGVAGYYLLADQPTFVRMLAVIGALIVAAFVAVRTRQGRSLFDFLKASDMERRKVVWPTRQETIQTTIIIGVVTVIISLVLFAMDSAFSYLVRVLIGGGS